MTTITTAIIFTITEIIIITTKLLHGKLWSQDRVEDMAQEWGLYIL
jgi:hypothetical protein